MRDPKRSRPGGAEDGTPMPQHIRRLILVMNCSLLSTFFG